MNSDTIYRVHLTFTVQYVLGMHIDTVILVGDFLFNLFHVLCIIYCCIASYSLKTQQLQITQSFLGSGIREQLDCVVLARVSQSYSQTVDLLKAQPGPHFLMACLLAASFSFFTMWAPPQSSSSCGERLHLENRGKGKVEKQSE